MACYQKIHCPTCDGTAIIKSGKSSTGTQRYLCQDTECDTQTFMLDYHYKACEPGMTEKIVEMAINSSGIRETAGVLNINKNTVINTLKKENSLVQVNPNFQIPTADAHIELACEAAEI